jgi:RNA polymerase sigma-70 factor, ECF subfamily
MTNEYTSEQVRQRVESIYRTESRRIFATLIRLLGDFDLAEDALHDAFRAAMEQWPRDGVPANPRAWLISTGRFKAIDGLRRRSRFETSLGPLAEEVMAGKSEDVQIRKRLAVLSADSGLGPDLSLSGARHEIHLPRLPG